MQPVWDDDELLLRSVPGKLMHIPGPPTRNETKSPARAGLSTRVQIEGNESEIGLVMCP